MASPKARVRAKARGRPDQSAKSEAGPIASGPDTDAPAGNRTVNYLADPSVHLTLTGVFRRVLPEIVLLGTACAIFLLGSTVNRRWLWFLVALGGVTAAAIVAGVAKTTMPEAMTAAPIIPDAAAAFVRWVAL